MGLSLFLPYIYIYIFSRFLLTNFILYSIDRAYKRERFFDLSYFSPFLLTNFILYSIDGAYKKRAVFRVERLEKRGAWGCWVFLKPRSGKKEMFIAQQCIQTLYICG